MIKNDWKNDLKWARIAEDAEAPSPRLTGGTIIT